MERKHVDFVSAVIMLIVSIYVLTESFSYYQQINQRMVTVFHQSPGFFPFIIGSVLFICSLLLLIRSISGGALKENFQKLSEGASTFIKSPTALKSLIGCVWMSLYIFLLLPGLGFLIGSVLFLLVLITFLMLPSYKGADLKTITTSITKTIIISAVAVGAIYIVFQVFFRVPLP